jgi:organic hydroperoxide reductase OsmC/OhrA
MSTHTAKVRWERGIQAFVDNRYSRLHRWSFDGGAEVAGSSSPQTVRPPLSDPAAVDPEEAFVASIASCHMLWFLSLAAKRGFRVDSYVDEAEGTMAKNERGKLAITVVTLRPAVEFSGEKLPTREDLEGLHHEAHEECFIANSIRSEVRLEPRS